MATFGRVVLGVLMGLLSLLGLFMAANAEGSSFYQVGLMFTAFGYFMVLFLISQVHFDSDD